MSNELQTTGNKELEKQSQNAYIDKRVSNLEEGGYYKKVISPEDYLASRKSHDADGQSQDLELSSELGNNEAQDAASNKKIEPLKHWNINIKKKFDTCSESQQQAWLDSFKIVEKSFVKQLNALKDQIALAETILEPMYPYVKELKKLGQSPQEYIRTGIEFDEKLGQNPAYEIAKLISIHNVSYDAISQFLPQAIKDLDTQASISKYIKPLKEEIAQLKGSDGASSNLEKAEEVSDDIINKITAFYSQTDSSGKLKYPYAFDHIQDILELVQTGENLATAYNLVVNGERPTDSDNSDTSSESEVEYEAPSNKRREMSPREKEEEMLKSVVSKIRRR
jgi:hypothetical protein